MVYKYRELIRKKIEEISFFTRVEYYYMLNTWSPNYFKSDVCTILFSDIKICRMFFPSESAIEIFNVHEKNS